LGHLLFLLDSVFSSNQNLLEDDGLFYPSKTPEITALYGHYSLKTSIDDSLYNDLWEITINPATEIQYYISGSFWGRYIAVGAVDTGNGSVSLRGNKEILRL
jgi:hypothetical protein